MIAELFVDFKPEMEQGAHTIGAREMLAPEGVHPSGSASREAQPGPLVRARQQSRQQVTAALWIDQVTLPPGQPPGLAPRFARPGYRELDGEDFVELSRF
jgi:hypothetical protein